MDRYQRVERPRPESAINENEIRITTQGLIRNYIRYATSLLQEKQAKEIVLKAMGQAISKAVTIAEILKKRTPGLYQDVTISSVSITDVWEPIEEGLVPLETTRHVSMISITLSYEDLNNNSPGYQAPVFLEQPMQQYRMHTPQQQPQYQQQQQHQPQYRGRGGGRGKESWNYREEEDDKTKIVKTIYKIQAQGDEDDEDDAYLIDPIDFNRKSTLNLSHNDDDDVALVAEKGPVALRDFPHPRHLCANFPFNTTSHESYCSQCFCYACDVAAPCLQWTGTSGHCNVSKKPL